MENFNLPISNYVTTHQNNIILTYIYLFPIQLETPYS